MRLSGGGGGWIFFPNHDSKTVDVDKDVPFTQINQSQDKLSIDRDKYNKLVISRRQRY